MDEKNTLETTVDQIFVLPPEHRFGWSQRIKGDDCYHIVQNPEDYYRDCFAVVTGSGGGPGLRVAVSIIPEGTAIAFKILST
jgi:hypothetical protein